MMDTQLRYFGRLRLAEQCGTLDDGREVYFIDSGRMIRAIVRKSTGTSDQAMGIFLGGSNTVNQLKDLAAVTWADNTVAMRAKAWVAEQCRAMAAELREAVTAYPDSALQFTEMAGQCESKANEVSL